MGGAVSAALVAIVIPFGAFGQSDPAGAAFAAVDLVGRVIDTQYGLPVPDAAVRLLETRRPDGSAVVGATGPDGRFTIPGVPPGLSRVLVSRLGYADLLQVLDIRADQFVEVAIIPKPVVLEGIEVYVDRLQTRLRGLAFSSSTFDEMSLKSSPDMNVAQYLDSRPGLEFVPCFERNDPVGNFRQRRDCLRARGAMPIRPRIYIDDAPAPGGVQELASLPTPEIYRVEVIRGCGQIRVYTIPYVEGAAIRSQPLPPVIC